MRTFISRSLLTIAACMLGACSNTKSAAPGAQQASVAAGAQTCVMQSAGVNVLKLMAPADFKCTAADGALRFEALHYGFQFWLIPNVQTVNDAMGHLGPQIATEFKDFQAEQTTDLTIAGSLARQLVGPGHEADDGDPGRAELIVFKVGNHIFVALDHGEILKPESQQAMLALVQTAQMP